MISATLKTTGEVIDFDDSTPEQIVASYARLQEYEKVLAGLKKQLQNIAANIVGPNGTYEHDGKLLRVSQVQRMTYDMASLRQIIDDEDTLNSFLELSKGKVDAYIKANLAELGEDSTRLRASMIPLGQPYRVVKLERAA